jgi:hypothetical protein
LFVHPVRWYVGAVAMIHQSGILKDGFLHVEITSQEAK